MTDPNECWFDTDGESSLFRCICAFWGFVSFCVLAAAVVVWSGM